MQRLGISRQEIRKLELQYIISHPNSVSWKAYQLHQVSSAYLGAADVDTGMFLKRFQLYLGDLCNYDLAESLHSSRHWLCLHMTDGGQTPYTCFLLRLPPTPFVLIAGMRKRHLQCVMEALSLSLECRGWRDAQLSGRRPDALLDLLLHQHSQGKYSSFRLNQKDPNPLLAVAKRRCYEKENTELQPLQKRRHVAEETFGTNPLPKLEKFTFQLEAPLEASAEPIACKLKLSGANILEGIKQCVAMDYITLPISNAIVHMPSHASNTVVLQPH